jgi:hypothetical protein
VIWVAVDAGRPIIVGIGVAVGFAIAALTFHDVQETGASGVAVRDDLLIELSLDPGAAGSNEMHLYGFATTGGAGVLEDAAIDAVYGELDIGPLPLRLVRASPNHFLSYHADLPFSGVWTFDVGVRPVDGGEEHVSMEIGIK